MTSLVLYGSNVTSTTLSTACKLATASGGTTEVTPTSTTPASGNGYVELQSQGGSTPLNASQPAPTGKGWLLDSTLLEGNTINSGNWNAHFACNDNLGGHIHDAIIGVFKRSSGGTYTQIVYMDLNGTNIPIAATRTDYDLPTTSGVSMVFTTGDKLYIECFLNATSWASDLLQIYLSNSATAGITNDLMVTSPGYTATPITNTESVTETYSGSETVTTALFTLNSESIVETPSVSETVTTFQYVLSSASIVEPPSGSEAVTTVTTILSSPSVQMTRQDMDFESNHINVSPAGPAVKILARVYYGSPNNSQTINGELDAVLLPETISQLHTMKTRNDVLSFIRSYSYMGAILADSPQWYFRMSVASGSALSDISGRSYSAALNGGFTLSQAGALAVSTDTAISFNGSTGYASLSSLILPCVTAFTVECWFKVSSTSNLSNTPRLISQDNAVSNLKGFDFGIFPSGTTGAFFNVAVNGANKQAASSTVFSAGTWYHMVAVFDGSTAKIYTNGVQTASIAASGSMSISSNPLFLAALTGPANYLNGTLDECAGYGYALSPDRIKAHYNAGVTP